MLFYGNANLQSRVKGSILVQIELQLRLSALALRKIKFSFLNPQHDILSCLFSCHYIWLNVKIDLNCLSDP
jgi:hypothetical protein